MFDFPRSWDAAFQPIRGACQRKVGGVPSFAVANERLRRNVIVVSDQCQTRKPVENRLIAREKIALNH